jgi:type I restriction-modification system DNA methylase subunit
MALNTENTAIIRDLVSGFRANLGGLRDAQTSEAVVRQEYIDPFWKALGWDVDNATHCSHAEKDVLVEAPIGTIEGEQTRRRRPDYLFRIDGFPRFVYEAKRPIADLGADKEAIFQAKSYAWNAQIPFAILGSFEEFRLFDATITPYYEEPGRGLVEEFDLRFDDYVPQWDVLWQTFSREAVAGGSLERLLAKIKRVRKGQRIRGFDRMLFDLRGTELVDRVFLKHLEDYRLRFAMELYRENRAQFSEAETRRGAAELAEATQRLIDRLVFMRVCEDREIIAYGTLREAVNDAAENRLDLHHTLVGQFRGFDARFNGYLFKSHFSEELSVSAELLADFIRSLYQPESSYRFDLIRDDLLGIVYERFLGSSITVARGNVEAKPKSEVLHAKGVYYTPRFVVDTIIRRAVAPRVDGKSPAEVCAVRILDPACGSGPFLIAAYQYLVDYCCRYLDEHPESAVVPPGPRARTRTRTIAVKAANGRWLLTPDFKAELLTSCIHGVDIDAQAVEVTIMSLYLKVLENMPQGWQRGLLPHRLLPPLDNNIRCGNSLLSKADFDRYWDEKHGTLFSCDEDVAFRMNAFDWASETRGFGRLFGVRRGFDCVIGNPPYIRVQELNRWAPEECEFYKHRYRSAAQGNFDIYVVFIERALELLADDGLLGFICPHKFWQASYGKGIRQIIADGRHLRSLIDFTDQQVFHGPTTYTAIHVLSRNANRDGVKVARIVELSDGESQCPALEGRKPVVGAAKFSTAHPSDETSWFFDLPKHRNTLAQLESAGVPLYPAVCGKVFQGIITGADEVFLSPQCRKSANDEGAVAFRSDAQGTVVELENDIVVPVVRRQGFTSYVAEANGSLLLPYDRKTGQLYSEPALRKQFPKAWDYLSGFRGPLAARENGKFAKRWWCLSRAQNIREWSGPKVLVPYMINRLHAAWEPHLAFFVNVTTGGYGLELKSSHSPSWHLYVLGLLNSRPLDFYLRCKSNHFHSGYFPANKQFLEKIPIKLPATAEERRWADRIIERVVRIVEAKRKLKEAVLGDRATERLHRDIEAHEQGIDELVCRLYGVDEIPADD